MTELEKLELELESLDPHKDGLFASANVRNNFNKPIDQYCDYKFKGIGEPPNHIETDENVVIRTVRNVIAYNGSISTLQRITELKERINYVKRR